MPSAAEITSASEARKVTANEAANQRRGAVRRHHDDLQQADGHDREAAHQDHPQHRQEGVVGQEDRGRQHRQAQPLHDAHRHQVAGLGQVLMEQRLVQSQGRDAVQRDGDGALRQQPFGRHFLAQPLDVPAGRQRADAQVQDQPARQQQVEALAVDQGGDHDEQRENDHAAVEQAGLAVVLLHGQVEFVVGPLAHRQARRADEAGAADQLGRQRRQAQGKTGAAGDDVALVLFARALAQRLQGGTVPAGHAHRVARGEFDDVARRAARGDDAEPDRRLGHPGIVIVERRTLAQRGLGRGRRDHARRLFRGQHLDFQADVLARAVLVVPKQQSDDGDDADEDRNQVIREEAQHRLHPGMRQVEQGTTGLW
jgi:hypothetical protein